MVHFFASYPLVIKCGCAGFQKEYENLSFIFRFMYACLENCWGLMIGKDKSLERRSDVL